MPIVLLSDIRSETRLAVPRMKTPLAARGREGQMLNILRKSAWVSLVPQVAVKEEGARLACGARRLSGKMRCQEKPD